MPSDSPVGERCESRPFGVVPNTSFRTRRTGDIVSDGIPVNPTVTARACARRNVPFFLFFDGILLASVRWGRIQTVRRVTAGGG
jgi:hypothetical protein